MVDEKVQKSYLIMPDNPWYGVWDLSMTIILIFSCVVTPLQIALMDELTVAWSTTNWIVDGLFATDIFVSFNTATYDDDFEVIDDFSVISSNYFKSWFPIDLVSIIPFDLMIPKGNADEDGKSGQLSRLTKVLKLIKLLRLAKLNKGSSAELFERVQQALGISASFRWMFTFFFAFFSFAHLICCFWIIVGKFDPDQGGYVHTMDSDGFTSGEVYTTAFYYTITTITTVGYGDISASTFTEKIVAMVVMFAGVIAFSLASGSLTNYIMKEENHGNLKLKVDMLDSILKDHNFPLPLYSRIKKNLRSNYQGQDNKSVGEFVV
jgi:potassium voltage-gated channel Eag-related subfamily H member 8